MKKKEKSNQDFWRIEVDDWRKISIPTAELYLKLAEEALDQFLDIGQSVTNRSYTLLAVYVTFISALISFLDKNSVILRFPSWVLIILIVLFCGSFILFIILIGPKKIGVMGRMPKKLNQFNSIVNHGKKDDKDLSYVLMIMAQIENIQFQIDFMQQSNNKRLRLFKLGIILEGAMFIVFFSSLLIFL